MLRKLRINLVDLYFRMHMSFWEDRVVDVLGKKIVVCPGTFCPLGVFSTNFILKNMSITRNDVVLDLGCGTGVISVFAAEKARKVYAVDINPCAVRCTRINCKLNSVDVDVRQGDMFSPFPKTFFTNIISNPPYLPLNPTCYMDSAWRGGSSLNFIRKMITEASHRLLHGGTLQFAVSTLTGLDEVLRLLKMKGFRFKLKAKRTPIDTIYFIKSELRDESGN